MSALTSRRDLARQPTLQTLYFYFSFIKKRDKGGKCNQTLTKNFAAAFSSPPSGLRVPAASGRSLFFNFARYSRPFYIIENNVTRIVQHYHLFTGWRRAIGILRIRYVIFFPKTVNVRIRCLRHRQKGKRTTCQKLRYDGEACVDVTILTLPRLISL